MKALAARPSLVLDTSVALKWFVEEGEEDVPIARELQEAYLKQKCTLTAPQLLFFELTNGLLAGRKLSPREVVNAVEYVHSLDLRIEPLHWATLARSVDIASSCGATVYDSYFLAMALESHSLLVTADEVFLRKVRRYPDVISLRLLRLPD